MQWRDLPKWFRRDFCKYLPAEVTNIAELTPVDWATEGMAWLIRQPNANYQVIGVAPLLGAVLQSVFGGHLRIILNPEFPHLQMPNYGSPWFEDRLGPEEDPFYNVRTNSETKLAPIFHGLFYSPIMASSPSRS